MKLAMNMAEETPCFQAINTRAICLFFKEIHDSLSPFKGERGTKTLDRTRM
jgi:hypothetical protein